MSREVVCLVHLCAGLVLEFQLINSFVEGPSKPATYAFGCQRALRSDRGLEAALVRLRNRVDVAKCAHDELEPGYKKCGRLFRGEANFQVCPGARMQIPGCAQHRFILPWPQLGWTVSRHDVKLASSLIEHQWQAGKYLVDSVGSHTVL